MTDKTNLPEDQAEAWRPGDLYTLYVDEGSITVGKLVRLKVIGADDSGVYGLVDFLDTEHPDSPLHRCKIDELVSISTDTRAAREILEAAQHLSRRVLLYEKTVKDLQAAQLDLELQLSQLREIEAANKTSMTRIATNLAEAMEKSIEMLSAANNQNLEAHRRITGLLRKISVHEKRYLVVTGHMPPETGMIEAEEYELLRHRLASLEAISFIWCSECNPNIRVCGYSERPGHIADCKAECGGRCHRDHEALWRRYCDFEGAERGQQSKGEATSDLPRESV